MFSVRIVSTDHYLAPPLTGLDVTQSEFRGCDVKRVPVLRIFGATPAGQKTCMHVHGVFPYLYVPYDGTQPWERYLRLFATSLDKAINVANNNAKSNIQHVFKISIVSGIPMYGYHANEQEFLKIYLYNPSSTKKAADLLLAGAVMNKPFQPHEAHIPYNLQLFIDYNLYGMNLINVATVKFRRESGHDKLNPKEPPGESFSSSQGSEGSDTLQTPVLGTLESPLGRSGTNTPSRRLWDTPNIPSELFLDASVERQTTCELEVDVVAADILNRLEVDANVGTNPGLAAIWEDEKQRRRDHGESSQITPPESQDRGDVEVAESEDHLQQRLREIINEQKPFHDSESESDMSQGSEDEYIATPASQVDRHLSQDEDDLASSQDTLILEGKDGEKQEVAEEEPIISLESIQKVLSFSQSFSQASQQSGEGDKTLADVLAAMADESLSSSQLSASQVAALEEQDSVIGSQTGVVDEEVLKEEEEETLEMSQSVWDEEEEQDKSNPEDHNMEGMDETWTDSQWFSDEDKEDDIIPQLDGASDEKKDVPAIQRKRLGMTGHVVSHSHMGMQSSLGFSPYQGRGGFDSSMYNQSAAYNESSIGHSQPRPPPFSPGADRYPSLNRDYPQTMDYMLQGMNRVPRRNWEHDVWQQRPQQSPQQQQQLMSGSHIHQPYQGFQAQQQQQMHELQNSYPRPAHVSDRNYSGSYNYNQYPTHMSSIDSYHEQPSYHPQSPDFMGHSEQLSPPYMPNISQSTSHVTHSSPVAQHTMSLQSQHPSQITSQAQHMSPQTSHHPVTSPTLMASHVSPNTMSSHRTPHASPLSPHCTPYPSECMKSQPVFPSPTREEVSSFQKMLNSPVAQDMNRSLSRSSIHSSASHASNSSENDFLYQRLGSDHRRDNMALDTMVNGSERQTTPIMNDLPNMTSVELTSSECSTSVQRHLGDNSHDDLFGASPQTLHSGSTPSLSVDESNESASESMIDMTGCDDFVPAGYDSGGSDRPGSQNSLMDEGSPHIPHFTNLENPTMRVDGRRDSCPSSLSGLINFVSSVTDSSVTNFRQRSKLSLKRTNSETGVNKVRDNHSWSHEVYGDNNMQKKTIGMAPAYYPWGPNGDYSQAHRIVTNPKSLKNINVTRKRGRPPKKKLGLVGQTQKSFLPRKAPDASYTYAFHVPTPLYKRLKIRSTALRYNSEVKIVRMHPMDARRYSLLKIGREVVPIPKLTAKDLQKFSKPLHSSISSGKKTFPSTSKNCSEDYGRNDFLAGLAVSKPSSYCSGYRNAQERVPVLSKFSSYLNRTPNTGYTTNKQFNSFEDPNLLKRQEIPSPRKHYESAQVRKLLKDKITGTSNLEIVQEPSMLQDVLERKIQAVPNRNIKSNMVERDTEDHCLKSCGPVKDPYSSKFKGNTQMCQDSVSLCTVPSQADVRKRLNDIPTVCPVPTEKNVDKIATDESTKTDKTDIPNKLAEKSDNSTYFSKGNEEKETDISENVIGSLSVEYHGTDRVNKEVLGLDSDVTLKQLKNVSVGRKLEKCGDDVILKKLKSVETVTNDKQEIKSDSVSNEETVSREDMAEENEIFQKTETITKCDPIKNITVEKPVEDPVKLSLMVPGKSENKSVLKADIKGSLCLPFRNFSETDSTEERLDLSKLKDQKAAQNSSSDVESNRQFQMDFSSLEDPIMEQLPGKSSEVSDYHHLLHTPPLMLESDQEEKIHTVQSLSSGKKRKSESACDSAERISEGSLEPNITDNGGGAQTMSSGFYSDKDPSSEVDSIFSVPHSRASSRASSRKESSDSSEGAVGRSKKLKKRKFSDGYESCSSGFKNKRPLVNFSTETFSHMFNEDDNKRGLMRKRQKKNKNDPFKDLIVGVHYIVVGRFKGYKSMQVKLKRPKLNGTSVNVHDYFAYHLEEKRLFDRAVHRDLQRPSSAESTSTISDYLMESRIVNCKSSESELSDVPLEFPSSRSSTPAMVLDEKTGELRSNFIMDSSNDNNCTELSLGGYHCSSEPLATWLEESSALQSAHALEQETFPKTSIPEETNGLVETRREDLSPDRTSESAEVPPKCDEKNISALVIGETPACDNSLPSIPDMTIDPLNNPMEQVDREHSQLHKDYSDCLSDNQNPVSSYCSSSSNQSYTQPYSTSLYSYKPRKTSSDSPRYMMSHDSSSSDSSRESLHKHSYQVTLKQHHKKTKVKSCHGSKVNLADKKGKRKSLTPNQRLGVAFLSTRHRRKKSGSGFKLMNSLSILHQATLANLTDSVSYTDGTDDYKTKYEDVMYKLALVSPPQSDKGETSPPVPLSPEDGDKDTSLKVQDKPKAKPDPSPTEKHPPSTSVSYVSSTSTVAAASGAPAQVSMDSIYETPLSSVENNKDSKSPEVSVLWAAESDSLPDLLETNPAKVETSITENETTPVICSKTEEKQISMKEPVVCLTPLSQSDITRLTAELKKETISSPPNLGSPISHPPHRRYSGSSSDASTICDSGRTPPPCLTPHRSPVVSDGSVSESHSESQNKWKLEKAKDLSMTDKLVNTQKLVSDTSPVQRNSSAACEHSSAGSEVLTAPTHNSLNDLASLSHDSSSNHSKASDTNTSTDSRKENCSVLEKQSNSVKPKCSEKMQPKYSELKLSVRNLLTPRENAINASTLPEHYDMDCPVVIKTSQYEDISSDEDDEPGDATRRRQKRTVGPPGDKAEDKVKKDKENEGRGGYFPRDLSGHSQGSSGGGSSGGSSLPSPDVYYGNVVLRPETLPPTRDMVSVSAHMYGLYTTTAQNAFCSNPDDLPDKPRELGGNILRLESNRVKDLEEFESSAGTEGLKTWRTVFAAENNLFSSQSVEPLWEKLDKDPGFKFMLSEDKKIAISPCHLPPKCVKVQDWLSARIARVRLKSQTRTAADSGTNIVNKVDGAEEYVHFCELAAEITVEESKTDDDESQDVSGVVLSLCPGNQAENVIYPAGTDSPHEPEDIIDSAGQGASAEPPESGGSDNIQVIDLVKSVVVGQSEGANESTVVADTVVEQDVPEETSFVEEEEDSGTDMSSKQSHDSSEKHSSEVCIQVVIEADSGHRKDIERSDEDMDTRTESCVKLKRSEQDTRTEEKQMTGGQDTSTEEKQITGGQNTGTKVEQMTSEQDTSTEEKQMTSEQDTSTKEKQMTSEQDTSTEEKQMTSEQDTSTKEKQMTSEQDTSTEEKQMTSEQDTSTKEKQMTSEQDTSTEEKQMTSEQDTSTEEKQMTSEQDNRSESSVKLLTNEQDSQTVCVDELETSRPTDFEEHTEGERDDSKRDSSPPVQIVHLKKTVSDGDVVKTDKCVKQIVSPMSSKRAEKLKSRWDQKDSNPSPSKPSSSEPGECSQSPAHSTPVRRRSVDWFEPLCTPISTNQNKAVASSSSHDSSPFVTPRKPGPIRRLSSNTETSLRRSILASQLKSQLATPTPKRNTSQLDGPTPKNTYGFKLTQQNYQDAKALHEHQYLTTMSMEVHVETRGDLRPDPEVDEMQAIFYSIFNDIPPEKGKRHLTGAIIVDVASARASQRPVTPRAGPASPQPSTSKVIPPALGHRAGPHPGTSAEKDSSFGDGHQGHVDSILKKSGVEEANTEYVTNEAELIDSFLILIQKWDPDIVVGYEIQMLSWGYVLKRASHLGTDLCTKISRTPGSKAGNHASAAKDDWAADYTSEINIVGRIVINLWRLLRHEVTLNIYSFENVAFHVLHRRIPLYTTRTLSLWFNHRTHHHRWRVVEYYRTKVQGVLQIMEQLDLIGKTSEFARVFGIEFYHVLSRGSQYRVESMMLRIAKPMNFIPVSPGVEQRARQKAPECIPLNLEPESRFYPHPVVVVDFQSLYPSIMIAYNYCFSTCLGRLQGLATAHEGTFEFGCTSLNIPPSTLKKLEKDVTISPNGVVFLKEHVRKGILPRMVGDILNTRIMVKKAMKGYKKDKILYRLLDARQLGLKLIANVTYGYTGASFSGRMPCIEVGDSIVRKARETLERAIKLVEDTPQWRARVVYGDTDSMFIHLEGRTKEEAFRIGQEIADSVTAMFPKPIKLKFEKVYMPCVLQTKKRYVGFSYETQDQKEPVYDAKGIETVRRDTCSAVAKILERCIKLLFTTRDVSQVKAFVLRQCHKFMQGKVSIQDCIFAKEFRGMMGYKPGACVPGLEIARKLVRQDHRAEPRVGERIPYVIVYGTPGMPLIQLVRPPSEVLRDPTLRINGTYYITKQILPPLHRIFSLIGVDVFVWYQDMPKVIRAVPQAIVSGDAKKGTISQYFSVSNCPVCDEQTKQTICVKCMQDPQMVAVTLTDRIRHWDMVYHRLAQVCHSCMGVQDETQPCISLDCPILFRRTVGKNDVSRGEHLRQCLEKALQF